MSEEPIISPELWGRIKRAERGLEGPSPELTVEVGLSPKADAASLDLESVGPCKRLGRARVNLSAAPGDVVGLTALDQVKHMGLGQNVTRRRLVLLGRLGGLVLVAAAALFMIGPFGQVETGSIAPKVTAKMLVQQGMRAYDQADRQMAVDLWTHALKMQPDMRGLRLNLAWLCYEMGLSTQAMDHVQVLLDKNPHDAEALSALEVMKTNSAPKTEPGK